MLKTINEDEIDDIISSYLEDHKDISCYDLSVNVYRYYKRGSLIQARIFDRLINDR